MTAMLTEHMELVRDEYERTKADHALEDGCDSCTRGIHPDQIDGWGFDSGDLLCPECLVKRREWKLQRDAAAARKVCVNGHDITDPAKLYGNKAPSGNVVYRCRQCRRARSNAWRHRQTAKYQRETGATS